MLSVKIPRCYWSKSLAWKEGYSVCIAKEGKIEFFLNPYEKVKQEKNWVDYNAGYLMALEKKITNSCMSYQNELV